MKTTELKFVLTDNLLYVFQLPERISSEFCWSAHPTNFLMIDWFRPSNQPGETLDIEGLREFIRKKNYYRSGNNYLVLSRTGEAFLVDLPIFDDEYH
jgi:hypothetical protein